MSQQRREQSPRQGNNDSHQSLANTSNRLHRIWKIARLEGCITPFQPRRGAGTGAAKQKRAAAFEETYYLHILKRYTCHTDVGWTCCIWHNVYVAAPTAHPAWRAQPLRRARHLLRAAIAGDPPAQLVAALWGAAGGRGSARGQASSWHPALSLDCDGVGAEGRAAV